MILHLGIIIPVLNVIIQIRKTILKGAGKIAKVAAKRAGPIGAVMTAYEIGKTIPKISKSTVKGLKKKAKSGNVNIGRKL